jgi:hypothetical protein
VTIIASDQIWWCDERPKGALNSPESSSVTKPSAFCFFKSTFAINA